MTRLWRCFAFLLVSLPLFAQSTPQTSSQQAPVHKSPLPPYAGTWVGDFNGKPWLTVKLALAGEQISGSVQHARGVTLKDNGELRSIGDDSSTESVRDAKLSPDGLLLSCKDPATQEENRYLMRLTGEDTAEIRPVGMALPPGMPKPAPWKLTKQTAHP